MIDEVVRDIEERRTRSASAVATEAAKALRELTEREFETVEEAVRSLERNSAALRQANRSHTLLHTTQRRLLDAATDPEPESVASMNERLLDAIERVVEDVETSKDRAAAEAAPLLADGDTVLAHANSSTVTATLEHALADGKRLDLYVTESRPRLLGRRTARQFAGRDDIDVTVIVDGAAGHYMDRADRVLLGMNCLVDDVVHNRVGTYPIAAAADRRGVPVTVVGSSMKFVGSGFAFENSYGPAAEVLPEPPEGFGAENPGYDATPIDLVDTVVTEDGGIGF